MGTSTPFGHTWSIERIDSNVYYAEMNEQNGFSLYAVPRQGGPRVALIVQQNASVSDIAVIGNDLWLDVESTTASGSSVSSIYEVSATEGGTLGRALLLGARRGTRGARS